MASSIPWMTSAASASTPSDNASVNEARELVERLIRDEKMAWEKYSDAQTKLLAMEKSEDGYENAALAADELFGQYNSIVKRLEKAEREFKRLKAAPPRPEKIVGETAPEIGGNVSRATTSASSEPPNAPSTTADNNLNVQNAPENPRTPKAVTDPASPKTPSGGSKRKWIEQEIIPGDTIELNLGTNVKARGVPRGTQNSGTPTFDLGPFGKWELRVEIAPGDIFEFTIESASGPKEVALTGADKPRAAMRLTVEANGHWKVTFNAQATDGGSGVPAAGEVKTSSSNPGHSPVEKAPLKAMEPSGRGKTVRESNPLSSKYDLINESPAGEQTLSSASQVDDVRAKPPSVEESPVKTTEGLPSSLTSADPSLGLRQMESSVLVSRKPPQLPLDTVVKRLSSTFGNNSKFRMLASDPEKYEIALRNLHEILEMNDALMVNALFDLQEFGLLFRSEELIRKVAKILLSSEGQIILAIVGSNKNLQAIVDLALEEVVDTLTDEQKNDLRAFNIYVEILSGITGLDTLSKLGWSIEEKEDGELGLEFYVPALGTHEEERVGTRDFLPVSPPDMKIRNATEELKDAAENSPESSLFRNLYSDLKDEASKAFKLFFD